MPEPPYFVRSDDELAQYRRGYEIGANDPAHTRFSARSSMEECRDLANFWNQRRDDARPEIGMNAALCAGMASGFRALADRLADARG